MRAPTGTTYLPRNGPPSAVVNNACIYSYTIVLCTSTIPSYDGRYACMHCVNLGLHAIFVMYVGVQWHPYECMHCQFDCTTTCTYVLIAFVVVCIQAFWWWWHTYIIVRVIGYPLGFTRLPTGWQDINADLACTQIIAWMASGPCACALQAIVYWYWTDAYALICDELWSGITSGQDCLRGEDNCFGQARCWMCNISRWRCIHHQRHHGV